MKETIPFALSESTGASDTAGRQTVPETVGKSLLAWNGVTVAVAERTEQARDPMAPIEDAETERMQEYGRALIRISEDVLDMLGDRRVGAPRKLSTYRTYIGSDQTTLASIAKAHGLSRERIRQITDRMDQALFGYFKKAMHLDLPGIRDCVQRLAALLSEIDHDVVSLATYGLNDVGSRKRYAILNLLFGKELARLITEKAEAASALAKEPAVPHRKDGDLREAWERYRCKICYPSDLRADTSLPVRSVESEFKYKFVQKVRARLEKLSDFVDVIECPDIVYYSSAQTDHRPQFLLRLRDGTSVLVLVLPTVNMALVYNVRRCNELHRFCKAHGYGYLIMDDRNNTIYDIKSKAVDPALTEALNTVLNERARITWQDIKALKSTYQISNAVLAAYVLQNKLHFTMSPFCIKRREPF